MKKLLFLGLLHAVAFNSFAYERETVEISKPLIALKEATIDRNDGLGPEGGAVVEAKISGSFQSTFYSKQDCVSWVNESSQTLINTKKFIYSATCSNMKLAPLYFNAGHFVGLVKYL